MSVEYEKRGPFAIIKINRPDARNAVNAAVANGIEDAIDQVEGDDSVWVGILTGEPIPAERAYALGLVSRLVDPGQAVAEARRLADQITLNGPVAVWESRAVVRAAAYEDDETLKDMTNAAMATVMGSEDLKEGLTAFIEKRPPVWKGR